METTSHQTHISAVKQQRLWKKPVHNLLTGGLSDRRSSEAKSTSPLTDDLLRGCDNLCAKFAELHSCVRDAGRDGRTKLSAGADCPPDDTVTWEDARAEQDWLRSFLAPLREATVLLNMRGLDLACPAVDDSRALDTPDKCNSCLLTEPEFLLMAEFCLASEQCLSFLAGAGSRSGLKRHKLFCLLFLFSTKLIMEIMQPSQLTYYDKIITDSNQHVIIKLIYWANMYQ